jgi:hypothetical protein
MKNLIFMLKIILTIFYTAIFNIFISTNFDITILTLIAFSTLFSILFYNLLDYEIKLISDIKKLF